VALRRRRLDHDEDMPRRTTSRESALSTFLRTRRDRLSPAEVGLSPGVGLRRTPGLRREELAALAGISVDYYIRLERGSESRPSAGVVDALARALKLDEHERRHLHDLAAHSQGNRDDLAARLATGAVSDGINRILTALRPFPAFVTNPLGDLLAWNPSGLGLLPGIQDWSADERNTTRYAFLHPGARELYLHWEQQVAGLVSGLRRLASTEPEAQDLNRLVTELLNQSPDFTRLWQRYDIEHYAQGQVELNHPIVGKITPEYQVMRLDGTDGLTMMTFHAAADSPELEAFHTLDRIPAATE
jgi:transcriptional regulator with XRE-family HTH domain